MSRPKQPRFLIIGIIWLMLSYYGFAQEIETGSGGPLPPPVDIELTLGETPLVGEETALKLEVTPQEDMHADISCLLPEGIEAVREEGVIIHPRRYEDWLRMERYVREGEQPPRYRESVILWIGPLEGEVTREFTFRVVISDEKTYELIIRVEALAKWGVKEEVFVLDQSSGHLQLFRKEAEQEN